MFLPPKLTTIVFGKLIALTLLTASVNGQQADFERRMAAMQDARARAQAPAMPATRIASSDMGMDFTDPPPPPMARVASRASFPKPIKKPELNSPNSRPPQRVARRAQAPSPTRAATRVAQGSGSTYIPDHMGASPLPSYSDSIVDGVIVDGGSPVINSSAGCSSCSGGAVVGESYVDGSYVEGSYIDGGYVGGEIVTEGCSDCGTCGACDSYFTPGAYCGPGSCAPLAYELAQCWRRNFWAGVGAVVYNAEYFGGATSFRSPLFPTPGGAAGALSSDSSHGFYGGANVGFPLLGISGGNLSGQIGVRSVQTNFNGNEFSAENRDQLFVTAGVFRRVDYGFQAGVVADILHEEWFTQSDVVQIRGEVGWVLGGQRSFGFRFASNTQDDVASGTFGGNTFTNLVTSSADNYRFFLRSERPSSGYGEIFVGWSDLEQTVVGLDFDVAVTERIGVQAGFTYYLNDEGLPTGTTNVAGGNSAEAFNLFVGFVLRPKGRSYYDSYDRPLFSVADNGSFLITRENQ